MLILDPECPVERCGDNKNHSFYYPAKQIGEITLHYCGYERCRAGHSYGPAVRDHFYYHFIAGGNGMIHTGEKSFVAGENCGFLVYPGQMIAYSADEKAPWAYLWVAFSCFGLEQLLENRGVGREQPVINHRNPHRARDLISYLNKVAAERGPEAALLGGGAIRFLIQEICESTGPGEKLQPEGASARRYLEQALYYIETYYYRQITIQEIAGYVGIDISYLSRLFARHLGTSPVRYLRSYRLEIAHHLLQNANMTVGQAALATGFSDPLYFSRCYREKYGAAPSQVLKKRENP